MQYVKTLFELSTSNEEPLNEGLLFLREVWEKAKAEGSRYRAPYFGVVQLAVCAQEKDILNKFEGLSGNYYNI